METPSPPTPTVATTPAAARATLVRLYEKSIRRFYLPGAALFAGSNSYDGRVWKVSEGSAANTPSVQLALRQLQLRGMKPPLDPAPIAQRWIAEQLPSAEYGDIAWMLWAEALGGVPNVAPLFDALRRRLPWRPSATMELSWVLSALCHAHAAATRSQPDAGASTGPEPDAVEKTARRVRDRLCGNHCGASGLFYPSSRRHGWLRRRRPEVSISSVSYAIHALALFGRTFDCGDSIEIAKRCADLLCRLQGPEGQWWWKYRVATGELAAEYPIYAVNQDGAMLLALEELERALGDHRYRDAIDRGILWLFQAREAGAPLVDEEQGVVWRGIEREGSAFRLMREMRSYHSGRSLYAHLAGEGEAPGA